MQTVYQKCATYGTSFGTSFVPILHRKRVARATVNAATAVDAVGVAEETVLGIAGRVEAKGAGLGAETAFDAFAFPCHERWLTVTGTAPYSLRLQKPKAL